jgi:hypothetical protein
VRKPAMVRKKVRVRSAPNTVPGCILLQNHDSLKLEGEAAAVCCDCVFPTIRVPRNATAQADHRTSDMSVVVDLG